MIAVIQDLLELSAPQSEVAMVEASELPEPQRHLLDHGRDMTGTLEAFIGKRLSLKPLYMRREGDVLYRRVVLLAGERPVEYGAIRIDLAALPAATRSLVEAGEEPLGGLLSRAGLELTSEARGFLRTDAGAATQALGATGPLFGRLARLADSQGGTLADVVEILPPFLSPLRPNG
jgi:chorismate-pyruvate lyase